MGEIERDITKRVRRSKIQNAVLEAVVAAGILSVALVAPNAVRLLRGLNRDMKRRSDPKYAAQRAFWRLVERGYIVLEETPRGKFAHLTAKGENALSFFDRPGVKLKKPRRWDNKWRLLIFDIKEERRALRNKLRLTLEQLGFVRLQDSVWVYPYDCEDLILLLKADFRIGRELLYVVADRIENDGWLRKLFFLP